MEFKKKSVISYFYIFFFSFLIVRIVWYVVTNMFIDTVAIADFILNRVALCLFLVAYTINLFYWIDTALTTINTKFTVDAFRGELSSNFLSRRIKIALIITISVIILFSLICVILVLVREHFEGDPVFDANIIGIACVFFLISVGYLVFGLQLYCRVRVKKHQFETKMDRYALALLPIICCICFFFRFAFLIERPITSYYLPYVIKILSYLVPEIIPSLCFLYNIRKPPNVTSNPLQDIEPFMDASLNDGNDH